MLEQRSERSKRKNNVPGRKTFQAEGAVKVQSPEVEDGREQQGGHGPEAEAAGAVVRTGLDRESGGPLAGSAQGRDPMALTSERLTRDVVLSTG